MTYHRKLFEVALQLEAINKELARKKSIRMGRDAGNISDEVVAHLTGLMSAKATIALDINIEVPDGIPEDRVRIVSENCNTLKFKGHGFEER